MIYKLKCDISKKYLLYFIFILLFFINGCDLLVHVTENNKDSTIEIKKANTWTWISGSSIISQKGIYGLLQRDSYENMPGAHAGCIYWADNSGNFCMYGGIGVDVNGQIGLLNDMWKFDGSKWTWISGSNIINQKGLYCELNNPDGNNYPGARIGSSGCKDKDGNLIMFGGEGLDAEGKSGYLNDLWKFDGLNWTWISGNSIIDQKGICSYPNLPDISNIPGARSKNVCWIDKSGNFYIFGGIGFDINGNKNFLNELWKFDGNNWIYISTDSAIPEERISSAGWYDDSGNFWLFGGYGINISGDEYDVYYNDLWIYNDLGWKKISGDKYINQKGIYGIKGHSDSKNNPGSRSQCISWMDPSGDFWLFGGFGYDINGWISGYILNDLWKYDGTDWTWISGDSAALQVGNYGIKGESSPSNKPGIKNFGAGWTDQFGNLFLFGGLGYDSNGSYGYMNDLWKYIP